MAAVNVVTEAAGMESLRQEWQKLVCDCPTATPFQSYEWLATWWQFFGRARPGRRLFVVAVRDDGGRLMAIAPWMTSWWYGLPARRLSFMGEGVSDYHDVIAAPGREEEASQAIYGFIAQQPTWYAGDLNQLREGGLLASFAPGGQAPLRSQDFLQEACPYLAYPEGSPDKKWDALLGRLGKKMRYNVGYYERLLRRTHEVQIGMASSPDEADEALSALFTLHQRRWNQRWLPGVFGSRKVRDFHREVARQFLEKGWLRAHTLRLDGEIQAVLYCFAGRDRTCYYQAGFEPTLAKMSPGTVLTAHAIRASIDEGHAEFDFLRGNEPYKARWTGGSARTNTRRLIARADAALGVARQIVRAENSVEARFKHWMHHRFADKHAARE